MDSQVAYPRGDEYENAPPGEEQSPSPAPEPGKKSVLKKVKAKAKKLKDTLKKSSNSRSSSSGEHIPDDHDLDEEDDDDEEMEEVDQGLDLTGNKYGSVGLEDDPNAPMDPADPGRKPTHQVKVADPSGQGSVEETGVNPLIRSFGKMNVETDPEPELQQSHSPEQFADLQSGSPDQFSPEAGDESATTPGKNQSTYTQKISAATSAITDRAISAKNMVASKLGYGEKDSLNETQEENTASSGGYGSTFTTASTAIADKAVSAKNVVASKLGYGEKGSETETQKESSAATGDTESKFSAAASAVTDRAVSAKNLVASKLGYGEKEPETVTPAVEGVKEPSSSPVEYGKKVVNTVYEKVAGAGTTVAGKMRGTTAGGENEGGQVEGENKGGSVKDYLSEKLKPGEEDKALSEIISGALHKSKEEDDPSEAAADSAAGKVTESEEVKKRLGEEGEGSGTGKGMVGVIKDTVGSWMGRSGSGNQASSPANPSGHGVEESNDLGRRENPVDGEERRVLQESTY